MCSHNDTTYSPPPPVQIYGECQGGDDVAVPVSRVTALPHGHQPGRVGVAAVLPPHLEDPQRETAAG